MCIAVHPDLYSWLRFDMYPTLAEVLDLPVRKQAAPRMRAGSAGLDVPVRWVHVSEQRNPAGTLSGGELVLSIGVAAADPGTDVAALRDAGARSVWSSSWASTSARCRQGSSRRRVPRSSRWSNAPARCASSRSPRSSTPACSSFSESTMPSGR